ncbi:MAG TPA: hypothetical protein VHR86_03960 [Armatimonadota bacterium]|nr:hypothetical protein [Armatimonadota bacterium]
MSCARVATEIILPSLALVGSATDPAGMLTLQGTASGDALHALATGMPLCAQMKVKLRLDVRGATAATPATAVGEAEAVISEQLLPAADTAFSALTP